MSDSAPPSKKTSLISVSFSDLLGIGSAATALVGAIERGIGNLAVPWQQKRIARAEQESFLGWMKALKRGALRPNSADLAIGERTAVRVFADSVRHQANREEVAIQAIEEFRAMSAARPDTANTTTIDVEWVDRFWRLAQEAGERDIQLLWARILARQASGSDKFSPRTLDLLSSFTRDEAQELVRYASVTCKTNYSASKFDVAIVHSLHSGMASDAALGSANEKLRNAVGQVNAALFGSIGVFVESGFAYSFAFQPQMSLWVGSNKFLIRARSDTLPFLPSGSGHGFSPMGIEILSLIKTDPLPEFVEGLREGLSIAGLELGAE